MRRSLSVALCLVSALAGCTSTAAKPQPSQSAAASPSPAAVDYTGWAAGRSTPVAEKVYPAYGNADVDVLHYGLELSWAPDTKTLTGQATVQLRAAAELTSVRLDFSPAYTVDAVTLDGASATGTVTDGDLVVPGKLAKDANATLVVKYHGTPVTVPFPTKRTDSEPLGLTVTADGGLWTMQEPYGASTWYPANDTPSDKALYDIAVTVPAGWSAIASGTPKPAEGNTFRYTATDPVAAYLTTLAVGKYQQEAIAGPHALPITVWWRPGTDDKYLPQLRKSPQYLTWLESHFGPYPFPSAGIVLVPSASGMETQQMVTMGDKVDYGSTNAADNARYFEDDLVHEYAHHWFGDTVTPADWNDLWLNEGWAQYAQYMFAADRDHEKLTDWETWARGVDARLRAKYGPPGTLKAAEFAQSNVYTCPALMLHQIRKAVGDTEFYAMAKDWAQQHRDSTQSRASFIAFVNQHTGKDFTALINTWLDSASTPK